MAIRIHNLWKSFQKQDVLKGLNLHVHKGETLVILGRSGVGKSVLLKHILGITKPDSGYVEVDGLRISELSERNYYKNIRNMGMLFQGAALFDSMTVGENIAFYLQEHGDPHTKQKLNTSEIQKRVRKSLEMVNLSGTEDVMPSELSGGMRKRAALARLIIYRPQIILYDEPTTGLDSITSKQINEMMVQTQRNLQATSVVVTHDIQSALFVGNRLAFFDQKDMIFSILKKEEFIAGHFPEHPLIRSFFDNAFPKKQNL